MTIEENQCSPKPVFAHQIEESFTRILDYYGIDWRYEPRTFPLLWDDEKKVIEAFTPDFYLPEQDLYIELTTLRPRLNNFKNRRIRLLKELYPKVNIKLLNRRDLHKLMIRFGLEEEARLIQGTESQTRK